MASCKFCGKEIVWMKEGRKNVPVEVDGAKHDCVQMRKSLKSTKDIDPNQISAEEMKRLQERMVKAREQAEKRKKRYPKSR